jgi:hypothetical protein
MRDLSNLVALSARRFSPEGDDGWSRALKAFRDELADAGLAEGQNVEIEYRWADNRYEKLPSLVAELLRRQAADDLCRPGTQQGTATRGRKSVDDATVTTTIERAAA